MKNLRRLGQNGCTVLPKLFLFIFKAMKSGEHFISEDDAVNIALKNLPGMSLQSSWTKTMDGMFMK